MRILTFLAVILTFSSTARADVFELDFWVDTGGFDGFWRFADGPEGNTIGGYSCNKDISSKIERDVTWYRGECSVLIKPVDENTTQSAYFLIQARHAITPIEIGGSNRLAFPEGQPITPTISLAPNDTGGVVTINTADIYVEPNGFPGLCSFEYIVDDLNQSRNSCDGHPTRLPLGTTLALFAPGRDANPVHISHLGVPYPIGNGRVYQAGEATVAFRTVDVMINPVSDGLWNIEGVTPAKMWMTGPHTLRLVQNNAYNLSVNIGKKDLTGAQFKLEPRCGTPAQTVYVPDYGFFYITQSCSP